MNKITYYFPLKSFGIDLWELLNDIPYRGKITGKSDEEFDETIVRNFSPTFYHQAKAVIARHARIKLKTLVSKKRWSKISSENPSQSTQNQKLLQQNCHSSMSHQSSYRQTKTKRSKSTINNFEKLPSKNFITQPKLKSYFFVSWITEISTLNIQL